MRRGRRTVNCHNVNVGRGKDGRGEGRRKREEDGELEVMTREPRGITQSSIDQRHFRYFFLVNEFFKYIFHISPQITKV